MTNNDVPYKIYLAEDELPRYWFDLRPHLPHKPAPILHPGTLKPCTAEDLFPIFCEGCVKQELNETENLIEIPEEVRNFYKMYR
ncbi:MAG: TrpB-like pyridoxal-phosphate dependent enzyme, partial [Peptococcaceae bacterium]|nr:TrpB-like pyridoxal-phosphate dependent enzyme [Peptococcaceae bacterium]